MTNIIFLSRYFWTGINVYVPLKCGSTGGNLIEENFSILLVFPVGGAKSGV